MILFSKSGARPDKLALEEIKDKEFAVCFIKDKKYLMKHKANEKYLEEIFKQQLPYCICDEVIKNVERIQGCWNPTVICVSKCGAWVGMVNNEVVPINVKDFTQEKDKDVYSCGLKYLDKPKVYPLPVKPLQKVNIYQRGVLNLFTSSFDLSYAKYDKTKKRWITNYNGYIVRPRNYNNVMYVGKIGGWMLDSDNMDVAWGELQKGKIDGRTFGKVEAYINKYIKEQKAQVLKTDGFDYYDEDYYTAEVQAAWLTLQACKLLKARNGALNAYNLNLILKNIKFYNPWNTKTLISVEEYFSQHIDHICMEIL